MENAERRYRVTKQGASLTRKIPDGPYCWRFKSHPLTVGEIITRRGVSYVGSVAVATFESADGTIGEFEPNSWGTPRRDYIEEIK